jgi:hypothetical protein
VTALEPTRGGRREAFALAQIDPEVRAARQLGDAIDGRLQRVRERKLRNRLADHADDRLGAPQRAGDEPDAPAAAQRERGARGKRREKLEVALGGPAVVEVELQGCDRRLPEHERRDALPSVRVGTEHDDSARALLDGPERLLDRVSSRRSPTEAEGREEGGRCVRLEPPKSRARGSGCLGGEADDLLCRLCLVGPGGERLAEELE